MIVSPGMNSPSGSINSRFPLAGLQRSKFHRLDNLFSYLKGYGGNEPFVNDWIEASISLISGLNLLFPLDERLFVINLTFLFYHPRDT